MKKILLLLFISITCVVYSQKQYVVTAKSGLSIRNKPSIKGDRIGKLDYGEKITIIAQTDFSFTTENINGYWVRIQKENLKEAYVFNGFLKPFSDIDIQYSTYKEEGKLYDGLVAKINTKEIKILSIDDEQCFSILEVKDYDYDGVEEILLELDACGGNCCGNSIMIYSYNGKEFVPTEKVGYDFDGIKLNYDKNKVRQFIVDEQHIGHGNTTLCEDEEKTYVFENAQLKLIKTKKQHKRKALLEIKSEDFEPFNIEEVDKIIAIEYDIDNNGIKDRIESGYFGRWGVLHEIKIIMNGKGLKNEALSSSKRIGILNTKTNNVHDLVLECEEIFVWNGKKYVYDKKKSKKK